MNCHLAHKLSWEPLVEMYVASEHHRSPSSSYLVHHWEWYDKPPPPRFTGPLRQFVQDLRRLLCEFRATDASTEEEMERFDPKVWGECGTRLDFTPNHNPRLGYYESLLWGYIKLNLLLADPARMPGLMIPVRRRYLPMTLECMLGYDYESHPQHFSSHLAQAFCGRQLKPLTPDVVKILRDHAALMFRCMYSVTGESKLLDEKFLTKLVFEFFTWAVPGK